MKQIYKKFKSLNKFEITLFILTILAGLILFQIVLDLTCVPSIFSSNITSNINEVLKDLSIGIITSSIFYLIIQWFPERIKRSQALELNLNNINKVINIIDRIISIYHKTYFSDKSPEELIKEDFLLITGFDLFKNKNKYNTIWSQSNRLEIFSLNFELKKLINITNKILLNNEASFMKDDLKIQFYNIIDLEFYEWIKDLQSLYESPLLYNPQFDNNYLTGYNMIEDNKTLEEFQNHLFQLYVINNKIKSFLQS
ncbi:hypothetical protein [Empedobacter brevis]|uniref:hypothetical protein n=1 Tax=Empedobacter brevis TaxID=247 RepID=UPI0028A095CA|nr:hypothetical protein [Empedobacter brevis]